jgi:hypothetical protein
VASYTNPKGGWWRHTRTEGGTGRAGDGDVAAYAEVMCRNIRTLHNFAPPATSDEVQAAALQYVRKVSGAAKPSAANQAVFDAAVLEIAHVTQHLLDHLVTNAPPKDREVEAAKARERAQRRYAA